MEIQNLHDLVNAVEHTGREFKYQAWWRGQAEDWPLLSGIHRPDLCTEEKQVHCEKDLTIKFLLAAKTRHSHWPEDDYPSQLAMMQHYRLPTRLLDWSESPLIALFFAVQGADDKQGVLWALIPSALNIHEFRTENLLSPYGDRVRVLFEAPFRDVDDDLKKVAAVIIRHIDVRMTVQLSAFTIHGANTPLNEHEGNERFLVRFVIPARAKSLLRIDLFSMGIRESHLFPDLDHLANELKTEAKLKLLLGL